MLRLKASSAWGRCKDEEGAYLRLYGCLKKSGGNFELRIRTFLRRTALLLREGARKSWSSGKNCMLEI